MDAYLQHHGIKGQQWGVRRFQNEDGTLTAEGVTRYGRGKTIDREHGSIYKKEYKRLEKENALKRDQLQNKLFRLIDKYELDGDDGGGGNSEKYSSKQLERAKAKFWDYSDKIYELDESIKIEARKKAHDTIFKKYGEVGLSEMKHYHNVNKAALFIAALGVLGLNIWNANHI